MQSGLQDDAPDRPVPSGSEDDGSDVPIEQLAAEARTLCREGPSLGTLVRLRAVTSTLRERIDDAHPTPDLVATLFESLAQGLDRAFATSGMAFGLGAAAVGIARHTTAALADIATDSPDAIPVDRSGRLYEAVADPDLEVSQHAVRALAAVVRSAPLDQSAPPLPSPDTLAADVAAVLARTSLPDDNPFERRSSTSQAARSGAFLFATMAEQAPQVISETVAADTIREFPLTDPVVLAFTLIAVRHLDLSAFDPDPAETVDEYAQWVDDDENPPVTRRAAAKGLGVIAALGPTAESRSAAKTALSTRLSPDGSPPSEADGTAPSQLLLDGYRTLVRYGTARIDLQDIELLRELASDTDTPQQRVAALECLGAIVTTVDDRQYANTAFDGLLANVDAFDANAQRLGPVYGAIIAGDTPPQIDLALRAKCRAIVTGDVADVDPRVGVDILTAAKTNAVTTSGDLARTVDLLDDESTPWFRRVTAVLDLTETLRTREDATGPATLSRLVEYAQRHPDRPVLSAVILAQCSELVTTIDESTAPHRLAGRLATLVVSADRPPPVRADAATALTTLVRTTETVPFSPIELDTIATGLRLGTDPPTVRQRLFRLVCQCLRVMDRPGLELAVVNRLVEAPLGSGIEQVGTAMSRAAGFRTLLEDATSPLVRFGLIQRFRAHLDDTDFFLQMIATVALAEYISGTADRRLRAVLIEEYVTILTDADRDDTVRQFASHGLVTLLEETAALALDPGTVERVYETTQAPAAPGVPDNPWAVRERGTSAFRLALESASAPEDVAHLLPDIVSRLPDAEPVVGQELLHVLAVFADTDPASVTPYRDTIRQALRDRPLDADLRCRLARALAVTPTAVSGSLR